MLLRLKRVLIEKHLCSLDKCKLNPETGNEKINMFLFSISYFNIEDNKEIMNKSRFEIYRNKVNVYKRTMIMRLVVSVTRKKPILLRIINEAKQFYMEF